MKILLRFCILLTLLTQSCEDTKKQVNKVDKISSDKKEQKDTKKPVNDILSKKQKNKYPVITNENVVSFLTEYGKNNPESLVRINTQYGAIDIELFKDTKLHRANFIYLVKQGYFDDTFFYRVVPNFIIQGGNSDLPETNKKRNKIGDEYLIPAEINGRDHFYGSVSGAKEYRENPDKQTAPFEFFIFLGPKTSTSHLNGNYTVFGKVIKGMDVVEKIANLPADEGEWPLNNVYINAEIIN